MVLLLLLLLTTIAKYFNTFTIMITYSTDNYYLLVTTITITIIFGPSPIPAI